MSFSKRPGKNTPQCYTKPLDSLKTGIIVSSGWTRKYFQLSWHGAQEPQKMGCPQQTPIMRWTASNPAKVKTGTRPRAANEVPLLTSTTNRVIDMDTTRASRSSGTPFTVEKSPLNFADEDLPPPNTGGVGTEE
ncbi:hypothetical protein Tco_1150281 [Tanacetum coccineum]